MAGAKINSGVMAAGTEEVGEVPWVGAVPAA